MYYSASLFQEIGFNQPTVVGLIISGTNFVFTLVALKFILGIIPWSNRVHGTFVGGSYRGSETYQIVLCPRNDRRVDLGRCCVPLCVFTFTLGSVFTHYSLF